MELLPVQIVMEEVSDPNENEKFGIRWEQADRNSAWLQTHAHEVYSRHRGKFIVIAGEELFVGDTPEEPLKLAKSKHPEDEGAIIRYVYRNKLARVYAN